MKIIAVYYSSQFKKSLKKYASSQKQIEKKIKKFLENPFDKSLHTHKLTGKFSSYWSFSVTYHLRILFEFIDGETVGFVDTGTHEIYKCFFMAGVLK
jgi:addiction module RelE/StbE family toxin